jgi:hypothetical protein
VPAAGRKLRSFRVQVRPERTRLLWRCIHVLH